MEIVELARPGHVEIIGVQIMSKEIQERYDRLLEQMELQGKTQAQLTEEMEKLTKLLLASETAWQQRFGPMQRDFYRLAAIWKTTTVHWSNITEKCSHPAYRQIIALGPDVLPLIFDELAREPDDWFVALRAYGGRSRSVTVSADLQETANAWLEWAKQHGYFRGSVAEEGLSASRLEYVCREERENSAI